MKLACVISSVSRKAGGLHESVRRLAQSLAQQPEADVRVLGLADEYTSRDIDSWTPLATSAFRCHGPPQFGYAPQLGRALRETDSRRSTVRDTPILVGVHRPIAEITALLGANETN